MAYGQFALGGRLHPRPEFLYLNQYRQNHRAAAGLGK